MRIGFELAAAVLILLGPARAVGQTAATTVELTWNAPAGCPSREQVLAEVAGISGRHQGREPVRASVDIATTETGRWRAVMSLHAGAAYSERGFEAQSCDAVASAVALILAVTIETGVAPAPSPAPAPAAQESQERFASEAIVAAAGLVESGTMPGAPAAGAEVAAGWSFVASRWRLRALGGVGFFPPEDAPSAIRDAGGRFWLLNVFARLCGSVARGRLDVGPCIGGEIDRMAASGTGPATALQPDNAVAVWGAALAGAAASWRLSPRAAVMVRGEGVFSTAGSRFVLQPGDVPVHQTSRVGVRVALGLELRFL